MGRDGLILLQQPRIACQTFAVGVGLQSRACIQPSREFPLGFNRHTLYSVDPVFNPSPTNEHDLLALQFVNFLTRLAGLLSRGIVVVCGIRESVCHRVVPLSSRWTGRLALVLRIGRCGRLPPRGFFRPLGRKQPDAYWRQQQHDQNQQSGP